jgi:hypothetical protein
LFGVEVPFSGFRSAEYCYAVFDLLKWFSMQLFVGKSAMPKKTKTIIHVNQHVIKSNRKNAETNPVLTVKTAGKNCYASEVEILGASRIVYSPEKPLSCGAQVWIETFADVVLVGEVKEPPVNNKYACEAQEILLGLASKQMEQA